MNHRRLAAICAAVITLAVLSLIVRDSIVVRHAASQGRPVTVEGKVAWIGSNKMAVAVPGALPVTVDLSQVDLSDYATLMTGDWVIVTGTAPLGDNRVIATAVRRVEQEAPESAASP